MAPSSEEPLNPDETPSRPPHDIRANLTKTRIAPDLLAEMVAIRSDLSTEPAGGGGSPAPALWETQPLGLIAKDIPSPPPTFDVIIEFNRDFPGGIREAREILLAASEKASGTPSELAITRPDYQAAPSAELHRYIDDLAKAFGPDDEVKKKKSLYTDNYIFATLSNGMITKLTNWTLSLPSNPTDPAGSRKQVPLIYKIWKDRKIARCVYESARTIKCDAARRTYGADGKGVVWAIADTGIDQTHPHFRLLETLKLENGLRHKDFTEEHSSEDDSEKAALQDEDGHGTHVAGIIAGFTCRKETTPGVTSDLEKIIVNAQERDGKGNTKTNQFERRDPISGLAKHCKLLSLRVLARGETGDLSNLLAAIGYIQQCNDNGRSLKIHGLNLSLGYEFSPEWFAAGQSPLCVEVDRLVRSGVCVVVAAGNAGYGIVRSYTGAGEQAAQMGTISDPGNASLAITVGSTHRDMPHVYGVSYFSAKGPTADGRMKPDLIAPGERIVSCALMDPKGPQGREAPFREDSGTSMAAAHVSGAIAAFLSVRDKFKGKPEQVKAIFMKAATDLRRCEEFQGAGLLDLMRALQSVQRGSNMSEESWSPALWLEFDEQGKIDAEASAQLMQILGAPSVEDLVILSHGWNNDKENATKLYSALWTNTATNFPKGTVGRMVVAGVLWPSKAFRTDFDVMSLTSADLDHTLALAGGAQQQDLSDEEWKSLLDDFEKFLGAAGEATVTAAGAAAGSLTESNAHALVMAGATAVGVNVRSRDPELALDSAVLAQAQASKTDAKLLLLNLADPPQLTLPPRLGTALGLGSLVQGVIAGTRAAVARFLNYLTFYEMKKRAGVIGASLANDVLAKLSPSRPTRLHLVGHSFGGRLVTAATNQFTPGPNLELFSLTILQGAYSQNALARQVKPGLDGAFPSVVGRPTGPITITHTHNDLALTVAYPLASRLSHDITQAIGDASDEFGAMGANGPHKLAPGVAEPDDVTQAFAPKRGKVNTFLADGFIVKTAQVDAHNNVTNPTVGCLLAGTILA